MDVFASGVTKNAMTGMAASVRIAMKEGIKNTTGMVAHVQYAERIEMTNINGIIAYVPYAIKKTINGGNVVRGVSVQFVRLLFLMNGEIKKIFVNAIDAK